jgi:hypothetical protein
VTAIVCVYEEERDLMAAKALVGPVIEGEFLVGGFSFAMRESPDYLDGPG